MPLMTVNFNWLACKLKLLNAYMLLNLSNFDRANGNNSSKETHSHIVTIFSVIKSNSKQVTILSSSSYVQESISECISSDLLKDPILFGNWNFHLCKNAQNIHCIKLNNEHSLILELL